MNDEKKIKGYASPEGTSEYKEWCIKNRDVNLENFNKIEGIHLSSIGMGTYLGKPDSKTDKLVIDAALESIDKGINVIDTAINYRFQKAERAIGEVMKKLSNTNIKREYIFISTKNGYVPGDADRGLDSSEYIEEVILKKDLASEEEIINFNCTTIPYLEHQITQSLENLNVQTIDLLYLHNIAESQKPILGEEKFYEMVERCFKFLEKKRKSDIIRYYGLATWDCFRVSSSNPNYVSLKNLIEISKNGAKKVGNASIGFKFVMLPYNLMIPEAATMKFQEGKTFFEVAKQNNIGVFTSVPLMQGKILDEPQIQKLRERYSVKTAAQSALQNIRSYGEPIIAPLVGHKQLEHVKENLEVAKIPPDI
ncbi:MAG: Aldo/keto reductase [Promethearchaeota archaeon]|nr:MAG: Aldo/keto reductase [Candidatus Lokiarchaeota archaeon]